MSHVSNVMQIYVSHGMHICTHIESSKKKAWHLKCGTIDSAKPGKIVQGHSKDAESHYLPQIANLLGGGDEIDAGFDDC